LFGRLFNKEKLPPDPHEIMQKETASASCEEAIVYSISIKEIAHFKSRLNEFGFDFHQLAASSPKKMKIRLEAIHTAKEIANDPALKNYFLTFKRLPLLPEQKSLKEQLKAKRQRVYITALTLIFIENYEGLLNYFPGTGGKQE
jgi:RNA polymerase sigma factor